jgi:hypothetical protein
MVESSARTQDSVVNLRNTARQVLDYSTRGAYLLRCSLGDFKFLGDALACHIARPPQWRRETSLQASRRIVDVGTAFEASPRPPRRTCLQW